jgi:transcriptional regulator with XRE-family HTH domain
MPIAFAASTGPQMNRARLLMGLSLRAVAGKLHVSATTLQRWECSDLPLSADRILEWSEALERAKMSRLRAVRRATVARDYHRRHRQEQLEQGD